MTELSVEEFDVLYNKVAAIPKNELGVLVSNIYASIDKAVFYLSKFVELGRHTPELSFSVEDRLKITLHDPTLLCHVGEPQRFVSSRGYLDIVDVNDVATKIIVRHDKEKDVTLTLNVE